jgi:hypothetical protein
MAPDPTFAFIGGPCCRILDFVFAFCIMITFNMLSVKDDCLKIVFDIHEGTYLFDVDSNMYLPY